MNDSDAARTIAGRREDGTDLCAQIVRLEQTNNRLKIGLVGIGALAFGIALGGFTQNANDPIMAYTSTNKAMYRIYESGRIQYLRIEGDTPRTDRGYFGWGDVRIDDRHNLADQP